MINYDEYAIEGLSGKQGAPHLRQENGGLVAETFYIDEKIPSHAEEVNKPGRTNVDTTFIPDDLKALNRWVVWKYEQKGKKWTKVPYDAKLHGIRASSTKPSSWSSFNTAYNAYEERADIDGIGFVLTPEDPYVGVDLDHCIDDLGQVASWAQEIIDSFNSYTEITPSGHGIRIFLKGSLPDTGHKKHNIEVYDKGRYLSVTGNSLDFPGNEIVESQAALDHFLEDHFKEKEHKAANTYPTSDVSYLTDDEIIQKASRAENGEKFKKLWSGDYSDYPSRSEADLALCSLLAFWCNRDEMQMHRLFRQSKLMRSKWDEKHGALTYGQMNISKAIAKSSETFIPQRVDNLSYCPDIYSADNKDRSDNKNLATVSKLNPIKFLHKGSELQKIQCSVTWLWDKQIPEHSITLLSGKGGIGKTWLSLGVANAISNGAPFLELQTQKKPVYYIDFENSLPVLVDRIRRINIDDVLFWHNSNEVKPPKIDSREWELYKQLPCGLIIFDTLRAAQNKDENDSKEMALVMSRLKELRDIGFTILLLHHTPKSNDRTYKGSTAIFDLCDHVLGFYKVQKGKPEEIIANDGDEDGVYRIGTKDKTRYEPFHMFIEFDPEHGFVIAPDPDTDDLEAIQEIIRQSTCMNQTQVYDVVKNKLGIKSKAKLLKLLNKGVGNYWDVFQEGKKKLYVAKGTVHLSNAIYGRTIGQIDESHPNLPGEVEDNDKLSSMGNPSLSNCPDTSRTVRTDVTLNSAKKFFLLEDLKLVN